MDEKLKPFEPLLEQIEEYGKTSLEMFRLKSLNSVAGLVSVIVTRIALAFIISFFLATLSIAVALYLGDYLGYLYQGFLLVSAFYFVLFLVLILLMPTLSAKCKNYFIRILFN